MTYDKRGDKNPNYRAGRYSYHKAEGNSYRAMLNRCYKPNYRAYHRYGGRGIKVCDRWKREDGFSNFLEDMGKKPTPKHSLDRIDSEGDYTPNNCKWSTQREQMQTTSRNRRETVDGVTDTVAGHQRRYGVKTHTIYNRLRLGWSFEDALKTPVNIRGKRHR